MSFILSQELLRLPAVGTEMLASFEAAFTAKRSEKDQRGLIRKLLFNSGAAPLHSPIVLSHMQRGTFSIREQRKSHSLCLCR